MHAVRQLGWAVALCSLASCASLQVDRDLEHAHDADQYRASLATSRAFDGATDCGTQAAVGTWSTLAFAPATPVVKLPSGMNAAGVCVAIPAGARSLEVHAYGKGGMTYHQLTVVHPSVQFLDAGHGLVKDLVKPRLSPGESVISGFRLQGVLVLASQELAGARFAVFYLHPDSLEGSVDVQTGYEAIPVPFSPYGEFKVRFR